MTLDLPVRPALGRQDFVVSQANYMALAMVEGAADWPSGRLVICGPSGSGKSHLAAVWAQSEGAAIVIAASMATADAPPAGAALVVEDLDTLAGRADAQTALFHALNAMAARGGRVLMTALAPPARLPGLLPDLASRLAASGTARLETPDDALLAALLAKGFADRQVRVGPEVLSYLVARMERSFAAAHALVDRLDRAALAHGRAITRDFAAAVLDSDDAGRDDVS